MFESGWDSWKLDESGWKWIKVDKSGESDWNTLVINIERFYYKP